MTYTLNLVARIDDNKATIDTETHGALLEIVVRTNEDAVDNPRLVAHAKKVTFMLNNFESLLEAAQDLSNYREGSKPASLANDKLEQISIYWDEYK